jgi:tRNA pseudouridine55 synthase
MTGTGQPARWRDVHGILLLDKPAGLSSNQAMQRARRLIGAAKAGHTGSLDPLATGLLPICFGEATKIAGYLLGSRKAYRTRLRLGVTTTTADADGDVVATRDVGAVDAARIEAELVKLRGRIVQVPPVYSALKQAGVPLYERARRGEEVVATPREVDVFLLELEDIDGTDVGLHVECGSGTYIRSIVTDLGDRLGVGAHVTALRRLWIAPFLTPRMVTLDEMTRVSNESGREALDAMLLPVDAGVAALPAVTLDVGQAARFAQGQVLALGLDAVDTCRVHAADGRLIALGSIDGGGILRVRRGLNLPH